MAKFNESAAKVAAVKAAPNTKNKAGGDAYSPSKDLEVVSFLLTNLLQDQTYRSGSKALVDLKAMVASHPDPKFLAKAAVFARREFGMRSVTHVLAAELAGRMAGNKSASEGWMKDFIKSVILRPDDAAEIVSYYKSNVGKSRTLPSQLKKGVASRLREYTPEALSKYKLEGRALSMVDVINLTHPGRTEAIHGLMTGTLKPADTWEVAISDAGSDKELKSAEWTRLVREGKLGHFALLRNLRNIVSNVDPETRKMALEQLTDEKAIKSSLVFPFRYLTAYNQFRSTPGVSDVLSALDKASKISLNNIPKFEGRTLVALDDSGSMGWSGAPNGTPFQIGAMFAIALASQGADLLQFSTTATRMSVPSTVYPISYISSLRNQGGGTNFHLIFDTLKTEVYDRIIVISDMQGWVQNGYGTANTMKTSFANYKKRTGANPLLYSFDVVGYGTLAFPEDKVATIAGFSDKVFDLMAKVEREGGLKAMVNTIKTYNAF